MGRIVIAAFTPKPGMDAALRAAVNKHLTVLRGQNLITDRPGYVMRAAGGTIIEVFEWRSAEAIKSAHSNPAVLALWDEFEAACEYVPLTRLAECHDLFAEFEPIEP